MDRDEECDEMMECDDQGDGNVQVQEKKTEMVIRSCLMTSMEEEYSQTEMEITVCVAEACCTHLCLDQCVHLVLQPGILVI